MEKLKTFYRTWVISGKGLVLGTVGLIGLAVYPSIVYPYLHPEEYRKIQDEVRKGIDRAAIQPGGMRVWTDPFKEQKKEESQYLQSLQHKKASKE